MLLRRSRVSMSRITIACACRRAARAGHTPARNNYAERVAYVVALLPLVHRLRVSAGVG